MAALIWRAGGLPLFGGTRGLFSHLAEWKSRMGMNKPWHWWQCALCVPSLHAFKVHPCELLSPIFPWTFHVAGKHWHVCSFFLSRWGKEEPQREEGWESCEAGREAEDGEERRKDPIVVPGAGLCCCQREMRPRWDLCKVWLLKQLLIVLTGP